MGGGLWRLAVEQRQRHCRIERYHQQRVRHRGRCRLSVFAEHHRGLRARWRRHQLLGRQQRQRPIRSVPGRRYLRHTEGAAYISAALAYGWQDITTNRIVTVAGIDQLRAEFNANTYSGRLEGGYRFVAPWTGGIGITPYAAGQFTTFDLPGYAEQAVVGSPAFVLDYAGKSVTDVRSELGIRTDKSFAMADGVLTLRTRFAWAHDYDPDRSIAATFQALPGASFVVNGAAQASDSALTTASIDMKWRNGWSAAATFEGEFSDVTASYAGKGVVRYTW
ncbi:autotransporter outer membrane beta-barrel domain-containing protein [Bradyrhizobium viridifuturi]|uniref:autotransporter outer membrane beta-barrel domain-containing protein n=1 Tax=Bradyrhizobium viridifuturi TaxID=1654716 RepID=UPI001FCE0238|nr:autotransporter outer membrane beta-barrel domain-containing protein [Bradyrhizobium viridifuturi]